MSINKDNNKLHVAVVMLLFFVILTPFLFIDISTVMFAEYIETGNWIGHVVYILLLIVSVVVAPFTMPLFFISGGIFGPQVATIYNVIGWSIGAIVAFLIARYFNKGIFSQFVLFKKIKIYEQNIPPNTEFLSIVLLRMILPVDILSYTLGFFSNISFVRYVLSTVVGIIPFAVIFAYGGSALFSGEYIIFTVVALIVLIFSGIGIVYLRK